MDKSFIVSTSLIAAASGLAIWALMKLYETKEKLKALKEKYNNPKAVQKCLKHQYGSLNYLPLLKDIIPIECENFHERLSKICKNICTKHKIPMKRVLDVGCGTGAASFHLSEFFEEVIGTDTSYFMTVTCQMLKDNSETTGIFPTEGGYQSTSFRARISSESKNERVKFWDEDASNLSHSEGLFSCVVVANSLTDLSHSKEFLVNISDHVPKGGLLLIADTYDWPNGPESHLDTGGLLKTFDFLKKFLRDKWEFTEDMNAPFYFPLNGRKAIVGNAHITAWQRKVDPVEI